MDSVLAALGGCCCHDQHLTEHEVRLIGLLAAGSSTQAISLELRLSPHTVTHQLGSLLKRCGVRNRTELVARAYAGGILVSNSWPPARSGRLCLETRSADHALLPTG
ncbi:helix-turn-helix transcriptional regulator [Kitasatospora cineracea]|uniref:helix-turn-helix domain-containing protein n=1 Tax=Kitasatospora cineracea TaxID=88074 RepID=UPI00382F86E5